MQPKAVRNSTDDAVRKQAKSCGMLTRHLQKGDGAVGKAVAQEHYPFQMHRAAAAMIRCCLDKLHQKITRSHFGSSHFGSRRLAEKIYPGCSVGPVGLACTFDQLFDCRAVCHSGCSLCSRGLEVPGFPGNWSIRSVHWHIESPKAVALRLTPRSNNGYWYREDSGSNGKHEEGDVRGS